LAWLIAIKRDHLDHDHWHLARLPGSRILFEQDTAAARPNQQFLGKLDFGLKAKSGE
jgi:hypothetical protein